jgi:hypothetical protein
VFECNTCVEKITIVHRMHMLSVQCAAAIATVPTLHTAQCLCTYVPADLQIWITGFICSLLVGILQQAATLAAVSALVLSLCLSAPSNAAARVAHQQQVLQETQHMLQLGQQHQQQQQQQQQQPWGVQQQQVSATAAGSQAYFTLSSSSNSGGSAAGGLSALAASTQQQQQQQQQHGQLLFSVGSQVEDGMLEAVRQIEAQVDRAFGAFSSGVHMIDAAQASSEQVRAKTGECGCLWLWVSFVWEMEGAWSREPGTGRHAGGSEADRGAS